MILAGRKKRTTKRREKRKEGRKFLTEFLMTIVDKWKCTAFVSIICGVRGPGNPLVIKKMRTCRPQIRP